MLWRLIPAFLVMIIGLVISLVLINSRYQTVKQNYQTLTQQYQTQIEAMKLQKQKLEALHQLDIQYTDELTHAKAELAKLHDAVGDGNKRLHINAVCPTPKAVTAKIGYDEATAQLSETAREHYFHLRKMMIENEKQTEYLQQYINTQCLSH